MGTASQGRGPVLVVEDDPDIRDTIAQILEGEGYDVAVADNGKMALEALTSAPAVRLILLDLMMPVMDGWSFRDEQQKNPALAGIPVVVVSADGDVRLQAGKLGANGYLRKPVGIDALLDTVARYCRH